MLGALSLILGLTLAAPGSLRTAVVITGNDDLAAGSLQKELEKELSNIEGIELVPAHEVAAALAGTAGARDVPLPPVEQKTREEWEALFTQVSQAYRDDRLQDALQRLNDIRLAHEKTAFVPTAEIQRRLLWHATLLLAQGEAEAAESRVRGALTIDPAATIDGRVFPPGVRNLATTVTQQGFRRVRLDVFGVPAGGRILVDGRPIPEDKMIPVGSHRVAAWAPGYRWVEQPVNASENAEVSFTLPLAPSADADQLLRKTASLGPDDIPDREALELFAKAIGARALVIGSRITTESDPCDNGAVVPATGRIVGVVWRASRPRSVLQAPRFQDDAAGIRKEAQWLSDTLQDLSRGFFAMYGTTVRAGIGSAQRLTRVYDESNKYSRSHNGIDLRGHFEIAPGYWTATLETEAVFYSGGVRIAGPGTEETGGPVGKVGGGQSIAARFAAGRRLILFGNTFTQGTWVAVRAHASAEHYEANDLADEEGNKLGFFPSERVLAAGPEARVGTRVPGTADVLFEGAVVGLWRRWSQFPEGTLGTRPKVGVDGLVELSASFRPFQSLSRLKATRLHATVRTEYRSIRLHGVSRAPVEPRITNALVDQVGLSGVLSLEWRP